MISLSTKIIRKLAGPDATIFNDRLVDGRRSYKVWGWNMFDYDTALTELEAAGLKVKLVLHRGYSGRGMRRYTQPRLHVG